MSSFVGLLRTHTTSVWFLLVAATLLSLWLGTDDGLSTAEARSVVVLVVAFVKIRFVGLYFMDLRDAPLALRSVFEGYCFIVCLALIGFLVLA